MKIYITRHGQTEWNTLKKMQGWQNSNLTEKGIEDAIRLGKRLEDINFSKIYSSPLGRAKDTANYIKGNRDIEIELLDGLREMGFGSWEGVENEKVMKLHKEQYDNFWNKPELYKREDSENFEELFKRVEKTLEYIIEDARGENILIVSHAVTIKTIYALINNYKIEEFWIPPYIDGTSLTVIELDEKEMKIILEADTSHYI